MNKPQPMTDDAQPFCLNLLERFGDIYRISFDPAYSAYHIPRDKLDPWMMQLLCRRGVIYPHGGDRLAVEVDGRPKAAKALAALPGIILWQDGDQEKTFVCPLSLFDQVAAIVRPRKRRRLPQASRAAFAVGRTVGLKSLRASPGPGASQPP